MNITGTHIHYYFICKRKLWFFSRNITMESNSDIVSLGKLLHEESYKKNYKEILIDNIKMDFINNSCEVHEIKKSMKMKEAHIYQLLYYLYTLKRKGIRAVGFIDYPLLKKREKVELTEEKEKEIECIVEEIRKIIKMLQPPSEKECTCNKKSAYYDLCRC